VAGTNAVAAKKAIVEKLRAALAAVTDLASVQVMYVWDGKRAEREFVYGGRIRFDHEYLAFGSSTVGGGRMPRLETATIAFAVMVRRPDSDQIAADERVIAIGAELENALALDPTLNDSTLCTQIVSGELEPLLDDDGVAAQLTYDITVRSELI
jgi:hypothetical protein